MCLAYCFLWLSLRLVHSCSGRDGSAAAVGDGPVVVKVAGSAVAVVGASAVAPAAVVSAVASTNRESGAGRPSLVAWSRRPLHSSAYVPDTLPVTLFARVSACISRRACLGGCWAPGLVVLGPWFRRLRLLQWCREWLVLGLLLVL